MKKSPRNWVILLITCIGLTIFLLINQLIFASLPKEVPNYGILDFEFAWTASRISEIFAAWGSDGMILHANGIYWDFLYILSYGALLAGLILLVSRKLTGKTQLIGLYMTFTPFLAGVFDCIENILLLTMLNNPSVFSPVIPLIAGIMATIKFSILFVGVVFFLRSFFVWLTILVLSRIKSS
nr:hypothetical protein DSAG12_03395 [Candidatus Prometheoarchaeum syntrophicum]